MPRFVKADVTITVLHPSTSASLLTVSGKGDLNIDGFKPGNREAIAIYDRDDYEGLVPSKLAEQSINWSLGVPNASMTDAVAYKYNDFIHNTGAFAAIPTADPGGRVKTYRLRVAFDDGTSSGIYTFNSVHVGGGLAEGDELMITISATNYNGFTLT